MCLLLTVMPVSRTTMTFGPLVSICATVFVQALTETVPPHVSRVTAGHELPAPVESITVTPPTTAPLLWLAAVVPSCARVTVKLVPVADVTNMISLSMVIAPALVVKPVVLPTLKVVVLVVMAALRVVEVEQVQVGAVA